MATHVSIFLGAILTTITLAVDNSWHPPDPGAINNLDLNLGSDGVFDFIFDTSLTPDERYGQYNYCNMPHVRRREYVVAPAEYELVYVEIVCSILFSKFGGKKEREREREKKQRLMRQ